MIYEWWHKISKAFIYLCLLTIMMIGFTQPCQAEIAFSNQIALRYNPLGLQNELYFGYKKKLFNVPKKNILFGKSYLWTGPLLRVTPQFSHIGGFIRTLPIAVLELQASLVGVFGFSDAESVQSKSYFTSATKEAIAQTGSIIDNGWLGSLQARLQYKKDAIAVRSTHLFRYFDIGGTSFSTMFYDQNFDLILPFEGWAYQMDNDLLYADDNKAWVVGLRHTYAASLSDQPTVTNTADKMNPVIPDLYNIHRVGPLVAWKFNYKPPSQQDKKYEDKLKHIMYILSQWHVHHPLRTGNPMPTGVPYFAIAYVVSGGWLK